jgi:hypothetical protein
MQARPLFKDRRTFPSMADPLLQGRYPMRALYQAMAVAAMCLQETAVMRPQIGDVVMALNHLANQRHEPGEGRRNSREVQRSSRGGVNTPERRMQMGDERWARDGRGGGVNTPERRMQMGGEDRWGRDGRGGYENVRQAGSRRREDEYGNGGERNWERERRGGNETPHKSPRRRDEEYANGGGAGYGDSNHSRKPSADESESYSRSEAETREAEQGEKYPEAEQPVTSYGAAPPEESARQSPQVERFIPAQLRQEYAYPPSTREHPAFAGTAKSAILERMPSYEARRGGGGGAALRHRVLDRTRERETAVRQQQIAEAPERGGGLTVLEGRPEPTPGWDLQNEETTFSAEGGGRNIFDPAMPGPLGGEEAAALPPDSLENRYGLGNFGEDEGGYVEKSGQVEDGFGSVVYVAPIRTPVRDYEQSGGLAIENLRRSFESPLSEEGPAAGGRPAVHANGVLAASPPRTVAEAVLAGPSGFGFEDRRGDLEVPKPETDESFTWATSVAPPFTQSLSEDPGVNQAEERISFQATPSFEEEKLMGFKASPSFGVEKPIGFRASPSPEADKPVAFRASPSSEAEKPIGFLARSSFEAEKPVGFQTTPSFKARQDQALDGAGRVAFLWQQQQQQQQPSPSANPFDPSEESPRPSGTRSPVLVREEKRNIVSARSRPRTPERLVGLDVLRDSLDITDFTRRQERSPGWNARAEGVGREGYAWAQVPGSSSGRGLETLSPSVLQDQPPAFGFADGDLLSGLPGPSLASLAKRDNSRLGSREKSPENGYRNEGAWNDGTGPKRVSGTSGSRSPRLTN